MPGLVDLLRKKGPQGGLDLRQETVAVTGGNGFFGHKLVEALLAAGTCRVVSMDLAHTRAFVPSEQLCLAKVDIRDAAAVQGAIEGVTMVVHSASFFGQPAFGSFGDGADVYAVNVGGTQNVLDAALTAGSKVQRLVYISSSSAILGGDREFVDAPEDTPYPTSYLDHYGPSKAAAERLVLAADSDRLRTCVVRPSGIYGIGETLHLPRILTIGDRLFNYIPIYFAGRPVTDWTHVDNLSWGTFLAFDGLGVQGMARKEILHITDGPAIENLDFFRPSLEACGNTIIPLFPVTFWLMLPFVILAELFCLLTWTWLHLSPFMTRIEAFKACRTHTLGMKRTKQILPDFSILVTLAQGMAELGAHHGRTWHQNKRASLKTESAAHAKAK